MCVNINVKYYGVFRLLRADPFGKSECSPFSVVASRQ